MEHLKVPPHSIEAEQSVLGGLMLDNEAWLKIADRLSDKDFYRRDHQLIFVAIRQLLEDSHPCDLITLSEWLEQQAKLDLVGGLAYLGTLAKNTPSAANITAYADIVRERSVLRQLVRVGTDIANSAFETQGRGTAELLDTAEREVFAIAEQGARDGGFVPIKQLLAQAVEKIDTLFHREDAITGIATGFTDFDEKTAGLQASDLIIVAGRPSMGKCCAEDTELLLPDGCLCTLANFYQQRHTEVISLHDDWRLRPQKVTQFIDDGHKPVFRVTTRLGRYVDTTAAHPFLTAQGWKPLLELTVGEQIAVPRALPVFGNQALRDCEVKLLAYLLGDGNLTNTSPAFTNTNPEIQQDFAAAVQAFGGVQAQFYYSKTRATDIKVAADKQNRQQLRQRFSAWLREKLMRLACSQRHLAHTLAVAPGTITYWLQGKNIPTPDLWRRLVDFFAPEALPFSAQEYAGMAKNHANTLMDWLESYGLRGKSAHHKFIPAAVFTLPRPQLALFINRLFATDGWASVLSSGQAQLGFASVSERLIRQLQHLLLRFGIIARLKKRAVKYQDKRNLAWQLDITDAQSIQTFMQDIGIFGKTSALSKVQQALANKNHHTNTDLIPRAFWDTLERAKGAESWVSLAKRAGIQGYSNLHVGKRALTRQRLKQLADALDHDNLRNLASSDICWDKIVSIEPLGKKQVYDLSIAQTQNFIANDLCVHNTTFAMNIAEHVAIHSELPVAVFSMEMPGEQLAMRIMSSLGRIDQTKVRTGKLDDDDWPRLTSAINMLMEKPLYIDDTPALSPTEVRARARRLAREYGQLGLIVLDYLQLMQVPGKSDNRATEVAEISRSMKALAKELHVPIIALSQLNRSLEQRPDKRPKMADLRESGGLEQDADLIVFIYRDEVYNEDTDAKGTAEIIIGKQRNGPIGTVRLAFLGKYTRFENLAADFYTGNDGYE